MPISNTNPQPNDVVIFQRDPTNTYWGEVHISGSNLIMYLDSNGFVNADYSASFYNVFPPPATSGGGTNLVTGSTYPITASSAITASFALNTGGSGLITGSIYPITASNAITASFALNTVSNLITGSTYPITTSWANNSTSSSFATNSGTASAISFTPSTASFAVTASFANTASAATSITFVPATASFSVSSSIANKSLNSDSAISSSWASRSLSSSWAPQQQDINVNTISASAIYSPYIITVDPTSSNQVATKNYVDNVNPLALQYYFHSSSSDIVGYEWMYRMSQSPISNSVFDIVNSPSASGQMMVAFITPSLNLTRLPPSTLQIHYHVYRVGGVAANSLIPQLYIRSASIETLLSSNLSRSLSTDTTATYVDEFTLTSSLNVNLTDRLVVKFIAGNVTANPDVHFNVEDNTNARLSIPVPASTFVLSAGDTMSGPLTNSFGFYGTASWSVSSSYSRNAGTASVANSISFIPATASFAVTSSFSQTASFVKNAQTASYLLPVAFISASVISGSGVNISNTSINELGQLSVQNGNVFPNNTFYSAEFGAAISIKGSNAGFQIADRSNSAHLWQHYATNDFFRIWNNSSHEYFVMDYNTGHVGLNMATGSIVNQLDVNGNISCSVITASFNGTSSFAKTASALTDGSPVSGTLVFPNPAGDVLVFNSDAALIISSSGGVVAAGNGICFADFGFQTAGSVGYQDTSQTPLRAAVWNPFSRVSSSIITVTELETLHGISSSVQIQIDNLRFQNSSSLTASYVSSSGNVILQSGTNTIELFNTNSAQRLNIYNSFTDANNYKRLSLYGSSGDYVIDANGAGNATSSGDLYIKHSVGSHSIRIWTSNIERYRIENNGNFVPAPDNVYSLGTSGLRFSNVYAVNFSGSLFGTASVSKQSNMLSSGSAFINFDPTNTTWNVNAPIDLQGGIWDGANAIVAATFDDQHSLNDNVGSQMLDFSGFNAGTLFGNWIFINGGLTGSLFGTASIAKSASFATTASFYGGSVTSASYAKTASLLIGQGSGSFFGTASVTIYNSQIYPFNIFTRPTKFISTSGSRAFSSSNGAFAGMSMGDAIAIGTDQYNVVRVIDANNVIVDKFIATNYVNVTHSVYYPVGVRNFDINGTHVGNTSTNDGSTWIRSGGGGGNSGRIYLVDHINISGNDNVWSINTAPTANGSLNINNQSSINPLGPNVFTIDAQNGNNFEALRIFADGTAKFRFGIVSSSLNGTASWANNAQTASVANSINFIPATSSFATTSSFAQSVSGSVIATSDALVNGRVTSHQATGSNGVGMIVYGDDVLATALTVGGGNSSILFDQNGGFAFQATSRGNVIAAGAPGGSVIKLSINTSGNTVTSGSLSVRNATQVNALDVNGNISASVITASLFNGTASFALNSANALITGSTYPITSSFANSSSFAQVAISSSFASISSVSNSSSFASQSISSSYSLYAKTSFVDDINYGLIVYLPFDEGSGSVIHNYSSINVDATKMEVANGAVSVATGSGWNTNSKRGGYSQLLTPNTNTVGSASYIEFNNSTIAAGLPSMSFAIWYQSSGSTVGINNGRIVTKFNGGTAGEFSYTLTNSNVIGVILVNSLNQRLDQNVNTPKLNDNKWHQIAATYDGTTSSVYVDGQLCGATPFTGSLQNSVWKLRVGTFENLGLSPLCGYVDEFKLWNRTLTPNEILYLYNDGNFENGVYVDANGVGTISGSLKSLSGFTGSLLGTASYSNQSLSASFATTSSFATTASFAISASRAQTASFALNSPATTLFTGSTYQITSSWATKATTVTSLPDITDTAGKVGIGNTNPQVTLDVNGIIANSLGATSAYMNPGYGALFDSTSQPSVDWNNHLLLDITGSQTADYSNRILNNTWTGTVTNAISASFTSTASLSRTASYLNGNGNRPIFNDLTASKGVIQLGQSGIEGKLVLWDVANDQPNTLTGNDNTLDWQPGTITTGNGSTFGTLGLFDPVNGVYRYFIAEDGGITIPSSDSFDIQGAASVGGLLNVNSATITTLVATDGHLTGSLKGTALTSSYVSSSRNVTIQSGFNTTEFKNSSSAQTIQIYGAATTSASFNRLAIYQGSGGMTIESQPQGSASSSGDFVISHAANHSIKFNTNGTLRWTIGSTGDWLPGASTYNIGQPGQGVNNLWVNNINGSAITGSLTGSFGGQLSVDRQMTIKGDLNDMYLFNTQSVLWVQTSGSPSVIGLGNGIVYSDLGFQAGGGSGYFDATQTANRVAVWSVSNPFLSSSIVLIPELNTLSGINTGSTIQSQINKAITPVTWSAISAATNVTWSAAANVYQDRRNIVITGPTTMSIQNLYNGWEGSLKITNGNTGSLLFVTPTPKVMNGGSGSISLTNISGSVDFVGFQYDGTLYASVGNTFN